MHANAFAPRGALLSTTEAADDVFSDQACGCPAARIDRHAPANPAVTLRDPKYKDFTMAAADYTGLLNKTEAASLYRVSIRTLDRFRAPNGPLPCIKIGSRVLFEPIALAEFFAAHRIIGPGNAPAASKLKPSEEPPSNEPVHISTLMPELLARADSRRRSASDKRRRGLSQ